MRQDSCIERLVHYRHGGRPSRGGGWSRLVGIHRSDTKRILNWIAYVLIEIAVVCGCTKRVGSTDSSVGDFRDDAKGRNRQVGSHETAHERVSAR